MKTKLATVAAVLAIVSGGMSVLATQATAAEASVQGNCREWFLTGAGAPYTGLKVTCTGLGSGYFKAVLHCKKNDNGYRYTHYGERVAEEGWSTVWCDYNATIVGWGGIRA